MTNFKNRKVNTISSEIQDFVDTLDIQRNGLNYDLNSFFLLSIKLQIEQNFKLYVKLNDIFYLDVYFNKKVFFDKGKNTLHYPCIWFICVQIEHAN